MKQPARRGYTLFELIVVIAILILLAVLILPSIGAFRGDTRQRAAADSIRAELSLARALAKEEGRPYRVALSEDGTRIRRAPDNEDFATAEAFDRPGTASIAVEYPFEKVTAFVVVEGEMPAPEAINGWVTIATVLPDGTCREDTALIEIREDDLAGMFVRVRGLTAASRVVPNPAYSGGNQ